jgi:hypothetical protein
LPRGFFAFAAGGAASISLGFLRLGKFGRVIAIVLWCYIPFGILISVVPPDQAKALVLARTIFFVLAFVLSAILFSSLARNSRAAVRP